MLLLCTLVLLTIGFMAFLVKNSDSNRVCEKTPCCKKIPATPGSGGGGSEPEMDNGSFHHLIVSTIK